MAARQAQLDRLVTEAENFKLQLAFYTRQIAEAEKRGMDKSDADRLLVRRDKTKEG